MKTCQILTPALFAAIVFANGCSPAVNKPESAPIQAPASIIEEPPIKTQNTGKNNMKNPIIPKINVVGFRSLKASFDHGAAVYVGKVVKREPSPESKVYVELGQVTLSVVKTLRGPSRKTLVLPYSFALRPLGDSPLVWGPFDVGDNLMCVVIPGGTDPTTILIPGVDEAASRVVNVDKDPAGASEIAALCTEYNAKAGK
jgi:hypothetical protein